MIPDEAQRIKNWNTIAARALKRISLLWFKKALFSSVLDGGSSEVSRGGGAGAGSGRHHPRRASTAGD